MSYRDPDHTYRCSDCRQLLDTDEYQPLTVNSDLVCPDCCELCEFCGEWLDDENAALLGPLVRDERPENDHRFTAGHAHCVGQWILGCMAGIPKFFDADDWTKDELARFYMVAQLGEAVVA